MRVKRGLCRNPKKFGNPFRLRRLTFYFSDHPSFFSNGFSSTLPQTAFVRFSGTDPISFAQRIGFKEFAASPGCEDILLKEWYGEFRVNNSLVLLNMAQFIPFLYLNVDYVKDREIVELKNNTQKIKEARRAGAGEKKPERDIGFFDRLRYPFEYLRLFCYYTPFSVFWWYALSKIWFVLYFSAFLLFFYDSRIHWWSDHAIMEVFLWYWQFNLFGEVIYQGSKTGVGNILAKYKRYFKDFWNASELVTSFLMLVAGLLRAFTPDVSNLSRMLKNVLEIISVGSLEAVCTIIDQIWRWLF